MTRTLLASYCASLEVAHSILQEFNFRWNVRMATKNRGLPEELGEFASHYDIEAIDSARDSILESKRSTFFELGGGN